MFLKLIVNMVTLVQLQPYIQYVQYVPPKFSVSNKCTTWNLEQIRFMIYEY